MLMLWQIIIIWKAFRDSNPLWIVGESRLIVDQEDCCTQRNQMCQFNNVQQVQLIFVCIMKLIGWFIWSLRFQFPLSHLYLIWNEKIGGDGMKEGKKLEGWCISLFCPFPLYLLICLLCFSHIWISIFFLQYTTEWNIMYCVILLHYIYKTTKILYELWLLYSSKG